ncbi:MAG: efflux RND transporter periplasmic adaptor subunit [Paracoccaceae bacterium]
MRIFPIVLSVIVAVILYLVVIEREWLVAQFAAPEVDLAEQTDDATQPDSGVSADGLIKVVVQRSQAQVIDNGLVLRGQTEALRQVDVRSETSSTVVSTPIRKGTYVETGQPMCVLDPGTRGASLAEAKARLSEAIARKAEAGTRVAEAQTRIPEAAARVAEAQARLEEALTNENVAVKLSRDGFAADTRVKNTQATVASARASLAAAEAGVEAAKSGVSGVQSGIEAAQAGIESAEAGIAAAEKEIERLTMTAPFAGLLESDTAELGTLLQPGALCATILQLNPIKLVAFVPETEVNAVEVGARAGAQLASSQNRTVEGQVIFLSRSADPTTRTFRVEIEVPNDDLSIRDGQTAEILVQTAGQAAHLLPASSMTLNDEGKLGVRIVVEDNRVAFAPVNLLRDTPNGVWLTGLPEQVNVITIGQEFVTQGVQVAPTFKDPKS